MNWPEGTGSGSRIKLLSGRFFNQAFPGDYNIALRVENKIIYMIKMILSVLSSLILSVCSGQLPADYRSLDPRNPIVFGGDHIIYKGDTIKLGPLAFFIDGQLSDDEAAKYPFVFNTVNEAAEHQTDGTEDSPMIFYLAPWVYWIDDPDDPAVRVGKDGQGPYGLVIDCEWLKFFGLSDKAKNIVLACNRGQTIGSQGNFTMFRLIGDGTSSENVTFGNYCNVDLVFPLKPELNRQKRASAIVQAQLIFTNGDKIFARNTRFISRLNLMPFVGAKRALFDRCHFECTDDAMCATGVYLNCSMDFYSSKPFYATTGTGAILLNCDVKLLTRGEQYFTKGGGQVGVVDTRFTGDYAKYIGWRDIVPKEARNYQYNVTFNGEDYLISPKDPQTTVDIDNKAVLDAYRFEHNGKIIYNIYNLLRGNDNWDPLGMKNIVLEAEQESGKNYSMLPVQLLIYPVAGAASENLSGRTNPTLAQMMNPSRRITIETNKDFVRLDSKIYRFGICEMKGEFIKWTVNPGQESLAELRVSEDGSSCDVIPVNKKDEPSEVTVIATIPSGLEAAYVINVAPEKLNPPAFISAPRISGPKKGKLIVEYKLDMNYDDNSLVTWYRCTDAGGSNPVEVAVSRFDKPLSEYELSAGDAGYHIMVSVAPKHLRCDAGSPVSSVSRKKIREKHIIADRNVLLTDFKNVSTKNQPEISPGFWTMTHGPGSAATRLFPGTEPGDAWYYGNGSEGSAGVTGLLQGRTGRLLYTPVGNNYGDMKLSMTVSPSKTAGQGFSIAHLYMDVLIKFDTRNMSGYGLRFIRTTKYGDAVDCMFVKYDKGSVEEISKPVTTSCYRTPCTITVEVKGNTINAHAETTADYYRVPGRPEVLPEVNIETNIVPEKAGGFGIEFNGGASTMINEIKVEWK